MVYKLQKPRQCALGPIHPMDYNQPMPVRDIYWAGYPRNHLPKFQLPNHEEQLDRAGGLNDVGEVVADLKLQVESVIPFQIIQRRDQEHDCLVLQRLPRETHTPQSHLQDLPTNRNFQPSYSNTADDAAKKFTPSLIPDVEYYMPVPRPPRPPPKAPSSRNFIPLYPVPESSEESLLPTISSRVYSRRKPRTAPRKVANGRLTGFSQKLLPVVEQIQQKQEEHSPKVQSTAATHNTTPVVGKGHEVAAPANENVGSVQERITAASDKKGEELLNESESYASSDEKSWVKEKVPTPLLLVIDDDDFRRGTTSDASRSPSLNKAFWASADRLLSDNKEQQQHVVRSRDSGAFWRDADAEMVEDVPSTDRTTSTCRSRTEEWLEGIVHAQPPEDWQEERSNDVSVSRREYPNEGPVVHDNTSHSPARKVAILCDDDGGSSDTHAHVRTPETDGANSIGLNQHRKQKNSERFQNERRNNCIKHTAAVTKREQEQRRQRRKSMGW